MRKVYDANCPNASMLLGGVTFLSHMRFSHNSIFYADPERRSIPDAIVCCITEEAVEHISPVMICTPRCFDRTLHPRPVGSSFRVGYPSTRDSRKTIRGGKAQPFRMRQSRRPPISNLQVALSLSPKSECTAGSAGMEFAEIEKMA